MATANRNDYPALMRLIAEAREVLRNAVYADGLATVHTTDLEALSDAVDTFDARLEADCEPLCPACDGLGRIGGDGFSDDTATCSNCGGAGRVRA